MTRAQPTFHTPALEKLLSFSRKLKYITSIPFQFGANPLEP
jgi:hypothetical protein